MSIRMLLALVFLVLTSALFTCLGQETEADIDLEKGLVAYWKFDECDGDIAFDQTENHNDGALLCTGERCSPPQWFEARIGCALKFDGIDDYVDVLDNPSLDISEHISISLWIRTSVRDLNPIVYKVSRVKGICNGYSMAVMSGDLKLRITFENTWHGTKLAAPISLYDWQHLVGTYSTTDRKIRVYVNGVLNDTKDGPNSIPITSVNLEIGALNWAGVFFDGVMDEVRIYSRAISEQEVKQLYEQEPK